MKIEKISDNQIKFILSQADLRERNIKFSELQYGSEKTEDLFHEMLEQANLEYGFISESIPLVIEAIPLAIDSLMVLVTKLDSIPDDDHRSSLLAGFKDLKNNFQTPPTFDELKPSHSNTGGKSPLAIFSFDTLDEIIHVAKTVALTFKGESSVYKYQHRFYLILEQIENIYLPSVLSEFGNKYASSIKSKYHLMEHGEVITKEKAIQKYLSL